MAAKNQYYDNYVLQNEVNNMYDTALLMSQFCTPDTSLQAEAGDKVNINVYDATSAAKVVGIGEGNDTFIKTTLAKKEYEVRMVQTGFQWYDDEARKDPMVPIVGTSKLGADLVNFMNKDIVSELMKATLYVKHETDYFGEFIDAVAKLTLDPLHAGNGDETLTPTDMCFALVNKKAVADIRKSMKDLLKYVEPYVRTGYIGTVAGVNIYVSNDIADDNIIIGHRSAVKLFTKKDVELEYERTDANTRLNSEFARQVYIPALYDPTKVCIINKTGAKAE